MTNEAKKTIAVLLTHDMIYLDIMIQYHNMIDNMTMVMQRGLVTERHGNIYCHSSQHHIV